MNPILNYLKTFFATNRILDGNKQLVGMAKADDILQGLVIKKKVPGLAISVFKNGKYVFQKGYGYADLDRKIAVDPNDTIFRIASVSKPIAATALAVMVAEGKIGLDTSFYDYVPYYPKKRWDFTIRQLAGHTAGMRGYKGKEYALNNPYTIKESITIFKDDELVFEPGHGYLYNSFDWVLISLAMQEASGIPFEKYVQEKVLDPLGLTNTMTPVLKGSSGLENKSHETTVNSNTIKGMERTSIFYTKNRTGFRPAMAVDNFYKLAGGGYLSTAKDIAKLGQAYLNGELLSDAVRDEFLSSQEINGQATHYGLGWQVSEDAKGRKFYGHIGNGVGGYSNFLVYPQEQLVFSILINCTDPRVQEVLDNVVDELVAAL